MGQHATGSRQVGRARPHHLRRRRRRLSARARRRSDDRTTPGPRPCCGWPRRTTSTRDLAADPAGRHRRRHPALRAPSSARSSTTPSTSTARATASTCSPAPRPTASARCPPSASRPVRADLQRPRHRAGRRRQPRPPPHRLPHRAPPGPQLPRHPRRSTSSGEVFGALLFGHRETARFDVGVERVIRSVASQAAIALENANAVRGRAAGPPAGRADRGAARGPAAADRRAGGRRHRAGRARRAGPRRRAHRSVPPPCGSTWATSTTGGWWAGAPCPGRSRCHRPPTCPRPSAGDAHRPPVVPADEVDPGDMPQLVRAATARPGEPVPAAADASGVRRGDRPGVDDRRASSPAAEIEMLAVSTRQLAATLDRVRLFEAEREARRQLSASIEFVTTVAQTLQRSLLPRELPTIDEVEVAVRYLPGANATSRSAATGTTSCPPPPAPSSSSATSRVTACRPPRSWVSCAPACTPTSPRATSSTSRSAGPTRCWPSSTRPSWPPAASPNSTSPRVGCTSCARVTPARSCATRTAGSSRSTPRSASPLGVLSRTTWPVTTVELGAGDRLVLYTDGLVERRGDDIEAGVTRLCDALADDPLRRPRPGRGRRPGVASGTGLTDDVALLVCDVAAHPRPVGVGVDAADRRDRRRQPGPRLHP